MSLNDKVFADKRDRITPFEFDQNVANAFDDMVSRSVPFYKEVHQLILDMCDRFYQSGNIYDLGCSTATTICLISESLKNKNRKAKYIGVDNSAPMLEKAKEKLQKHGIDSIELIEGNIEDVEIKNADVVILNYTLQFLPLAEREKVLRNIYEGLNPGGIIILSEKLKSSKPHFEELITDLYYDFKRRNGYSELEISQKREALENVLIPLSPKQQIEMLRSAGFDKCDMLFRWYNFASYLGIK
ncbi:MAG: carboxy-S-adenosyl-L-methionine synthase CmoA [Oligoflexia bacterium]|nr:carboxy-S-adenosyl-L-methionine synthase CmoA [Oligoflexia bacterium]